MADKAEELATYQALKEFVSLKRRMAWDSSHSDFQLIEHILDACAQAVTAESDDDKEKALSRIEDLLR
ncbi:MAG: hypothetical protein ACJ74G_19525 [Blastocatellia bacterium]